MMTHPDLLIDYKEKMLLRKDPCGIICILMTYTMLLHCLYVTIFILVIPLFNDSLSGAFNAIVICTLVSLSFVSHARAAYSDPGFVPLPKQGLDFSDIKSDGINNNSTMLKPTEQGWTVCNRCDTYRPARAHHCRICKRCVKKLDHHCPWINNCVGEYNQKYFILFLFYIGLTSLYVVSFIIWLLIVVPKKTEAQMIHSIVICIEACLFGIFVITVFCDQINSIANDLSLIDSLQMDDNSRRMQRVLPPKRVLFQNVFGAGPIVCWLFPCDLKHSSRISTAHNINIV